ncbi:unnamed protein product, partial [Discosporangium mesarthrocarpum]
GIQGRREGAEGVSGSGGYVAGRSGSPGAPTVTPETAVLETVGLETVGLETAPEGAGGGSSRITGPGQGQGTKLASRPRSETGRTGASGDEEREGKGVSSTADASEDMEELWANADVGRHRETPQQQPGEPEYTHGEATAARITDASVADAGVADANGAGSTAPRAAPGGSAAPRAAPTEGLSVDNNRGRELGLGLGLAAGSAEEGVEERGGNDRGAATTGS